jgi:hypothetical protein
MAVQSGTGLNGPLKYKAHTNIATGASGVGQRAAYLNGCGFAPVETLTVLPYGTDDDKPRVFGYAWNGASFPGPYATSTTLEGIVATLTASSTNAALLGGGVQIVTSAGAPALNTYVSGAFFQVTAGKRMWYNIRFKLQTVASEAVVVGWVNSFGGADLTTLPTEGIFILKAIAGTDFTAHVRTGGTSTTVTTLLAKVGDAALADGVIVDLGILVDGGGDSGLISTTGPISFYVNGKLAGTVAGNDANIPTGALSYAIATNTTGGAKTMTVTQGLGIEEL